MSYLYPLWLGMLPVWLLALFFWYRYRQQYQQSRDEQIDPLLQPFVLSGGKQSTRKRYRNRMAWVALSGVIAIVALAGPSMYQHRVPLYETRQAVVVALDLSLSMQAEDVPPSRLQQAKFALTDLLQQRTTGYTALVVFAADAFAVAPLSFDVETLFAQLTPMSPGIMPAQGSRLDRAIEQSTRLLEGAGYRRGHILLVTDGLSDLSASLSAARSAHQQGYEVSLLMVGTEQGARIPLTIEQEGLPRRWLQDQQGQLVIARVDKAALQSVARAGGGLLLSLTEDAGSIQRLLAYYRADEKRVKVKQNTVEQPVNGGIWLLPPLLALLLYVLFPLFSAYLLPSSGRRFSFPGRPVPKQQGKHLGSSVVLFFVLLFVSLDQAQAFDWRSLWLNSKQQARQLLLQPSVDTSRRAAVEALLKDPQWQAIAAYRLQQYAQAETLFAASDSAVAWYNRGNALAQLRAFDKAIKAYQAALEKRPDFADAQYNLEQVQQARAAQQKLTVSRENPALTENHKTTAPPGGDSVSTKAQVRQSTREKEQQAYDRQWLKSIPDDPSGLWRRKFYYQYQKRSQQREVQPW